MTVNVEQMAKLIEATMKDSFGYRDEILERAGEQPWRVEDYPVEIQPYQAEYEQHIVIVTEAGQRFYLHMREGGIDE